MLNDTEANKKSLKNKQKTLVIKFVEDCCNSLFHGL